MRPWLTVTLCIFWHNALCQASTLCIQKTCVQTRLANTPKQRQKGLMHASIKDNQTMLFVFPKPCKPAFWMKNTPIDLWLVWVSPNGQIIDAEIMRANTLRRHLTTRPIQFALEMPNSAKLRQTFRPGHVLSWTEKQRQQLVNRAR